MPTSTTANGRKPLPRIPSVPPDWADLAQEVNRKEELTQHTFKCVVGLMLLAKPPALRMMLDEITPERLPMCHSKDIPRLIEYLYENSLIVLGCNEDPVLLPEIRKVGRHNITVYLTAEGVVFYADYLKARHHTVIAGDITIGPQLTDNILR